MTCTIHSQSTSTSVDNVGRSMPKNEQVQPSSRSITVAGTSAGFCRSESAKQIREQNVEKDKLGGKVQYAR